MKRNRKKMPRKKTSQRMRTRSQKQMTKKRPRRTKTSPSPEKAQPKAQENRRVRRNRGDLEHLDFLHVTFHLFRHTRSKVNTIFYLEFALLVMIFSPQLTQD